MADPRTLCLLGLGLVSGSLAASLRAREAGWRIRAADRRHSSLSYALRKGLIDEASESLEEAVEGAEMIVLAVPLEAVREILRRLGTAATPGQIVTDVAATKVSVLDAAREALPREIPFVGGHPVVWEEPGGVENAQAGLFEGKPCVLTPDSQTPPEALERVTALWREVGADVRVMEAAQHDRLLALVSQLPRILTRCLVTLAATEAGESDLAMAGSGLHDLSRVASGFTDSWPVVCRENRVAIIDALDRLSDRLQGVRQALEKEDVKALQALFDETVRSRGEPWVR